MMCNFVKTWMFYQLEHISLWHNHRWQIITSLRQSISKLCYANRNFLIMMINFDVLLGTLHFSGISLFCIVKGSWLHKNIIILGNNQISKIVGHQIKCQCCFSLGPLITKPCCKKFAKGDKCETNIQPTQPLMAAN